MAFVTGGSNDIPQKFLEILQNDLKNLSIETKKKFPQIKESCEEGIIKLRNTSANSQNQIYYLVNQILYPVVQGCETKDQRIVKMCLGIIQRLITNQAVDQKGARYITDTLWMLMESGIEEVKVLQSVTLLLTTNTVVHGDILARNLVLCFRLHFTKDSTTINTAGATIRQLVSLVFERVITEDEMFKVKDAPQRLEVNLEDLKIPSNIPPKSLGPCAGDAYLMFQDLVQLVNADQPYWLVGMTEMTRTFGLELLESVLTNFIYVFFQHPEFSFLLKERVCALVIKLFSPNVKYRNSLPASIQQATSLDKPCFPISVRLLRVVSILVQKYHSLLVTECEIFLSLIVKFLDPDKPVWQRSLALEVLHKLSIQPELLISFCECYDLKTHTTNVFQDIVNSLGAYVQSLFVNPQMIGQSNVGGSLNDQGQLPSSLTGPGMSPQAGFFTRDVWLPVITFPSGQAKAAYLEMKDKNEPPAIPDGYGISIAYACLLDIMKSISKAVHGNREESARLHAQLVNSSWAGLLTALSPLLDASTDDTSENILCSIQTFVSICGNLNLQTPRDAFITAVCKASLPPHYTLTVLVNAVPLGVGHTRSHTGMLTQDGNGQYNITGIYGSNEMDNKQQQQQVVAVGTPLPTASMPMGAHQHAGPVMLTAKNLQCMRALLNLAQCHGEILGTSWHLVLTTLQHLVWILGLKPSTGGSLKAGRGAADANSVITTYVMADLPVLSSMLSGLFESSKALSDVALHHLIDALCKLSHEAMELAYCNREPSLFAVAKLLETGIVNLTRVEVLWRPLTNHLLEVCQHPHIRMREWGVEAITYLVKAALAHKYQPPLKENQKLQTLLISPLAELSSVPHGDVRQRQLECVLQVLHGSGETLSHGWPLVLTIIGAISDQQGEKLIRIAFQCLQLVVTDFLPLMPWRCLPLCLETTAKFGSQMQELNISLTAIGLMWNISDYSFQNKEKLSHLLAEDSSVFPDFPGTPDMPPFDKLWMCLYTRLGDLCVDTRPAVRKSAGQTLFLTINAHASLLSQPTWQAVLWQVLFPLLDRVRSLSSNASNEKVDSGGTISIHHSRNTAQKQWAETQVLTLSGVARVFNNKRDLLQTLGDFPRAWSLLLEFVENAALSKNSEVSLAALRSFQEILHLNEADKTSNSEYEDMWDIAWRVWLRIAIESRYENTPESSVPSQAFLTALLHIFPAVFQHIKSRFSSADLDKLCEVLEISISTPVQGEMSMFILPSENSLTQLQEVVLHSVDILVKEAMVNEANMKKMVCPVFKEMLSLSKCIYQSPLCKKIDDKSSEWVNVNYVLFGEKALQMVVSIYVKTAHELPVIEGNVLKEILEVLIVPLSRRYDRRYINSWNLSVSSLMRVLSTGIPLARTHYKQFSSMWPQLALTLDQLLFPKADPPPEMTPEEILEDERVDCQIIDLLKDEVLSHSSMIPKEFILKVVVLLNKGSILSSQQSYIGSEVNSNLREELAKICFETLLQFSLLEGLEGDMYASNGYSSNSTSSSSLSLKAGSPSESPSESDSLAGRLAVTALLHRFQQVLHQYVEDESKSGTCPLPRYRLSEISFVLKAVATLVVSLKKSPDKVKSTVWDQLINLYPHLVDCTATTSPQVSEALREALLQYCDLLKPPSTAVNGL